MPLSINVGLSRKASRDFQSTGVSINVVAELDATLLTKPDELQRQIDDLYSQAQQAMDRQTRPSTSTRPDTRSPARDNGRAIRYANGNGNGYRNGNGNGNGNGHGRNSNNGGMMTESQRRAIDAIGRRLNIDPVLEARDVVGVDLNELTIRQASELIDHLKAIEPAANGRNGSGH